MKSKKSFFLSNPIIKLSLITMLSFAGSPATQASNVISIHKHPKKPSGWEKGLEFGKESMLLNFEKGYGDTIFNESVENFTFKYTLHNTKNFEIEFKVSGNISEDEEKKLYGPGRYILPSDPKYLYPEEYLDIKYNISSSKFDLNLLYHFYKMAITENHNISFSFGFGAGYHKLGLKFAELSFPCGDESIPYDEEFVNKNERKYYISSPSFGLIGNICIHYADNVKLKFCYISSSFSMDPKFSYHPVLIGINPIKLNKSSTIGFYMQINFN